MDNNHIHMSHLNETSAVSTSHEHQRHKNNKAERERKGEIMKHTERDGEELMQKIKNYDLLYFNDITIGMLDVLTSTSTLFNRKKHETRNSNNNINNHNIVESNKTYSGDYLASVLHVTTAYYKSSPYAS